MITIKNKHDLCFSRALVSAKAFVDQDPQYQTIFKGQGLQGHLAYKLHQETGVPRECVGCPKYSECKPILVLKGTRLKSMKESVVRYGIVTRRLILRLKSCVC